MDNSIPDLTTCDTEPIHILGKVQCHGFLIGVNIFTRSIDYISENIGPFIHSEAHDLLGKDLSVLVQILDLTPGAHQFILGPLLNNGPHGSGLDSMDPYRAELEGQPCYILLAITGNVLLVQFEPATKAKIESQRVIGMSVSKILSGSTLESLLENTAIEMKHIIGYDRVMIYKFDEDGHGEVVAEAKEEYLQPFLHLHYPASDIPKQARELYKINLVRIIADVDSEPSPIITRETNIIPLDLTHAELRAVSPIHIQYLKNMGVKSSFSISLVSKGELWGLIACHNYTPKFIDINVRSTAKIIGQILSASVEYRQLEENNDKFGLLELAAANLVEHVDNSNDIRKALTSHNVTIKDITEATGALVRFEQQSTLVGITPSEGEIAGIIQWLFENMHEAVYSTDRFPQVYKPAMAFSGVASGILACILSRELEEIIVWFKPEVLQEIQWAGNPEKPFETSADGIVGLSPRKSFESWKTTVRHTSQKWSRPEKTAVIKMREHIIYAIKRKANEIRVLNEKLIDAYKELDTFSYTVSHDLRTPLSSIKGYSELLLYNESLDDNAKKILERIRKCTDKMAMLITEILNYSQVGQGKMQKQSIDVKQIIEELRMETVDGRNMQFVVGETPAIVGDGIMVAQVFSNLIGNAIKYSSKSPDPRVSVSGAIVGQEVIYSISDNGIGIDTSHHNKVFELFKRMDNVQDIEGSGVGLAIVKKILDRHEGRIWFESTVGTGTRFHIAFNNN